VRGVIRTFASGSAKLDTAAAVGERECRREAGKQRVAPFAHDDLSDGALDRPAAGVI
jgi:hypothetical protein